LRARPTRKIQNITGQTFENGQIVFKKKLSMNQFILHILRGQQAHEFLFISDRWLALAAVLR